jgi:hypothetical protein
VIRSLVAWALKKWLSQYLPKKSEAFVDALLDAIDDFKSRGDDAVIVDTSGAKPRVLIKPADPGAKPVSLDDILRSENNPAG